MRSRLFFIIGIWFLVDLYFYQAVGTALTGPGRTFGTWGYWLFDGFILGTILYFLFQGKWSEGNRDGISVILSLLVLSLAPKLLATPLLVAEDIYRLGFIGYSRLFPGTLAGSSLSRSRIVSQVALGISGALFLAILYGIIRGKYNYRVRRLTLYFDDLPESFRGFQITHLSDIHAGSFDSKRGVQRGIDLANAQNSDVILFTRDLVNNQASEMDPWIDTFAELKAGSGKFSVLGNHDYGDYIRWPSVHEKAGNLERLKEIHQQIGFRLLLNEHVHVERNGERITLIGIENWGNRGFAKYGDLSRATKNLNGSTFNILLSHDPSHWTAETVDHPVHIHLTLAGHTHGMQFGFELFGLRWSPIKYIYPQWAGAYKNNTKHLYVNRGFGFLGFPGRVGIHPEITVITLERTAERIPQSFAQTGVREKQSTNK